MCDMFSLFTLMYVLHDIVCEVNVVSLLGAVNRAKIQTKKPLFAAIKFVFGQSYGVFTR